MASSVDDIDLKSCHDIECLIVESLVPSADASRIDHDLGLWEGRLHQDCIGDHADVGDDTAEFDLIVLPLPHGLEQFDASE